MIPRENVYVCEKCGGFTVTVDVDEGVTPFMIRCRAKDEPIVGSVNGLNIPGCAGTAYSSFYPKEKRPDYMPAPQWEWYKPDGTEIRDITDASTLQHIAMGGLIIRRRTLREPVYHVPEMETK